MLRQMPAPQTCTRVRLVGGYLLMLFYGSLTTQGKTNGLGGASIAPYLQVHRRRVESMRTSQGLPGACESDMSWGDAQAWPRMRLTPSTTPRWNHHDLTCFRPWVVFGTRPEAIKLAPVIAALGQQPQCEPVVCFTGQHRELVTPLLEYFRLPVHFKLDVMQPGQSLAALTAHCLERLDGALQQQPPTCVIAQGDTTTALVASLAAFYRQVPFAHVEAGLRTGDLRHPFPEEFNRRAIGIVAALHFAPTAGAADALRQEGIPSDRIHQTGNTVIDALLWTAHRERNNHAHWRQRYAAWGDDRLVLITVHRRESFGAGLDRICAAIGQLAAAFPQVHFVYPVHPNPSVQMPVRQQLAGLANVHLLPPLPYPEFVWLMDRAELILTDSGGIQEEAPSLGKPLLVLRDTTERPEAIACGCAELVGAHTERIVERTSLLLTDQAEYARRQCVANPFGDGHAAQRIAAIVTATFKNA